MAENNVAIFPVIGNEQEIDEFRVVHASIDSQVQRQESHTDFYNVTHEDWPSKKHKKRKEVMLAWIRKKRAYIREHWKIALAITILIVIFVLLFVTATLLLTLLPKKNSSIQANGYTPMSATVSTTSAPTFNDSSHGTGYLSHLSSETYRSPFFADNIQSVVIDSRRNESLLMYSPGQIMLLNTESKTIQVINITLEACGRCYIYDVLSDCVENATCSLKDVLYCCNECKTGDKTTICSVYGYPNWNPGSTTFKQGSVHFQEDGGWIFDAVYVVDVLHDCKLQMKSFNISANGDLLSGFSSSGQPCSGDRADTSLSADLLTAGYFPADDNLEYSVSIDLEGAILIQMLTGIKLQYQIHGFIDPSFDNETVVKTAYDSTSNSFLIVAFNGTDFSLIKFAPQEVDFQRRLYLLQPANFGFNASVGDFVDAVLIDGQLCQWYIQDNALTAVTFSFEWSAL